MRKCKLKHEVGSFCLEKKRQRKLLSYKVRQLLCKNATSVVRMYDKCKCYARTRQVSCECVTNASVMRQHDKCYTNMLQVLC